MRKLLNREVKKFAQDDKASEWHRWEVTPGFQLWSLNHSAPQINTSQLAR